MKIVCVLLEFTESKFQFLQQEILPWHLGCWYLEGRTDLWIKWKIPVSVTMFLAVICWENKQTRKRKRVPTMMNGASRDGQALLILQVPSRWWRILLFSRRVQCIVRRLFLLRTELWKSFQEILVILDGLFHNNSREQRRKWCVFSIKTKDKQMELYVGMHWQQCWQEDSGTEVQTNLQFLNGGIFSKKEATKWDSSIAKLLGKIWFTFVRFRDIQEEKQQLLTWWVTYCCQQGGKIFKIIKDVSSTWSLLWRMDLFQWETNLEDRYIFSPLNPLESVDEEEEEYHDNERQRWKNWHSVWRMCALQKWCEIQN